MTSAVLWGLDYTTILIVGELVLIALIYPKLPPLIPFLNSQPWGEARLYPSWTILLVAPSVILVFFINGFLGTAFYNKNTLIARILSFNSLLFALLSFFAFVQIIFLVF